MHNVTLSPEIIALLPRIEPGGLALYAYLASISAETGSCSPDYDTICEATGMARGTVKRYISLLVAAGLITVNKRFRQSTVYEVASSLKIGLATRLTTTTLINSSSSIASPNIGLMDNRQQTQDDYSEALSVFTAVTGLMAFNSRSIDHDIERIGAIVKAHGVKGAIDYLRPFYQAWCKRRSPKTGKYYNRTTTGWLDWAIGGEIPAEPGSNGSGQISELERLKAEGWSFPEYEHV